MNRDVNDHAKYEDELAPYLLDALSPQEKTDFERHLRGCEHCASQARWLQGAVDVLPETVEQVEPPPRLRQNLMEQVRADAATDREPAARTAPKKTRRRFDFGALVMRPATGFAVVAILIAGVLGYALGTGGDESGSTTVPVASTAAAPPGAKATIVKSGDDGVLRVENMPVPKGKVYELWIRYGDQIKPSSLFVVGKDGHGQAPVPGIGGASEVMVTLEPEGGSKQPTSQPMLQAEV